MAAAAADLGERVLDTPQNPISVAMTVDSLRHRLQRRRQSAEDDVVGTAAPEAASDAPVATVAAPAGPDLSAAYLQATEPSLDDRSEERGIHDHAEHAVLAEEDLGEPARSHAGVEAEDADTSDGAAPRDGEGGARGAAKGAARRTGSGVRGDTATVLGALMWQRHVSGVRVVCQGKRQVVGGVPFEGYGSSCDAYGHDYLTAAAALGGTHEDVDRFVAKLRKCWALV